MVDKYVYYVYKLYCYEFLVEFTTPVYLPCVLTIIYHQYHVPTKIFLTHKKKNLYETTSPNNDYNLVKK
jgi:hypothetical protein